MHHVARADIAVADGDVEVVDARQLQHLQRRLQRPFRTIHPGRAERLGQFGAADIDMFFALLLMHEAADARARLAGDDEPLPLRRRRAAAGGHDLDLVAVLQLVAQRQQPAVHLGADTGIADLAVHGIGEIDRRRAARQLHQQPLRREAEHLVVVQFELGVLQEFVRRRGILQDFQQVLHPAEPLHLLAVNLGIGRLVQPVRGDAVLRDVAHLRRCGSGFRSSGCAARAASRRCAGPGSHSISG